MALGNRDDIQKLVNQEGRGHKHGSSQRRIRPPSSGSPNSTAAKGGSRCDSSAYQREPRQGSSW